MSKPASTAVSLMAIGVLIVSLSACEKKEVAEEKGPAQKAGQQIDQAVVRAGEALNTVAAEVGKGFQEMGQKLQNAAQEAQEEQKKE